MTSQFDAPDSGAATRSDPAESALDLSALGRALWRRRLWIIVPTLLAALVSTIVVNLITPRFKSEVRMLIESRETAYNRPQAPQPTDRDRTLVDQEAVQSQVQLALSRDLARKVVRELKLAERPEFNPAVSPSILGRVLALVGLMRDASRMSIEERVLERYYDRLSVYPVDRSRVIVIEFQSEDQDLAAQVANAIADGYLQLQQESKQEATRQASQWLAGEIDRMRARVAEAEARVEEFRSKNNLYVGPNSNPLSAQQLGEVNSQLVVARAQRADLEAKARSIHELLRSGRPIEASEIVNSELIRRLNEQRVTLRAQLAEQSSTLLPLHPRIKELRAQISDLEGQIRTEAERMARSLETDARIAGSRVEELTANLDQAKRQASSLGEQDVQLRALEREAKAQRDLLESYLARYRDATSRESPDAVPADARIISRATPSLTAYFPRKLPIVLLSTLATFLFAALFAAVIELMGGAVYRRLPAPSAAADEAFEMPEQVAATPPAWIGAPSEQGERAAPLQAPARMRQRRMDALAEEVRALGHGIVVVCGIEADDQSSEVAIELARELASGEARVMLLDLDVERSPSRGLVSGSFQPGLSDILFGVVSFTEVIQRDPGSRAHVIPVGRGVRDTASLLTSQRLAIVLGALAQTYDHVVIAVGRLPKLPGAERLARFARAAILVAADDTAGEGAAASDGLAASGFKHVMLVAVAPREPASPSDRAAA